MKKIFKKLYMSENKTDNLQNALVSICLLYFVCMFIASLIIHSKI